MNDIAQQNLLEAPQVDWDGYGKSGFQVPPDARDAAGKPIVYYGTVAGAKVDDPDQGYLNYLIDPIVEVGSGYTFRFTRASVRPYQVTKADGTKENKKGNPNKLADFVRSTGLQTKPQTNEQYVAVLSQIVNLKKKAAFTIDWEAYNKDTGESVKGFNAFPIDPATGRRKAVLKAGDFYNVLDSKGNPTGEQAQVKSEVLFANARIRFFRDPKGTVQG